METTQFSTTVSMKPNEVDRIKKILNCHHLAKRGNANLSPHAVSRAVRQQVEKEILADFARNYGDHVLLDWWASPRT